MSMIGAHLLRIAICEDCPNQMGNIFVLLNKYISSRPEMEIRPVGFDCGEKLLKSLESGSAFDMYLLNAVMPGLNENLLLQRLRAYNVSAATVFMASKGEHASKDFLVKDKPCILKPIKEKELFSVLDKVIIASKRNDEQFFLLSTPERLVRIPLSSIICVELFGRVIKVYLENGTALTSKLIRTSFERAAAAVLENNNFLHIHKSFIINIGYVKELRTNEFIMKNNIVAPVPKHKYTKAKAGYLAFLSEQGAVPAGGTHYT